MQCVGPESNSCRKTSSQTLEFVDRPIVATLEVIETVGRL